MKCWWDSFKLKAYKIRDGSDIQAVTDEIVELRLRIFNEVPEGRIITDVDSVVIDVNPAFTKITGYSPEDVIGYTPQILNSGLQSRSFYIEIWKTLLKCGHWQGEVWNRKKNGEIYSERLSVFAIYDDNNSITHYVGLLSDITSNKRQQEQLDLLAHYDVLTQLPNRTLFDDRFNQAIAYTKRTNTELAVCFLDLDNFKQVNDRYGHHVGDSILIEVSQRITQQIRESDTVSRQGGDEFTMLLADVKSFIYCQQTLQRILDSIAQPIIIDDIEHIISASIGVTLYPADSGEVDTLLRHADHAMYEAKQAGRNRFQLYDAEKDFRIEHKYSRLQTIEQALVNDEFELYYQPKVNMLEGHVFGVEALIRWNSPSEGFIAPMEFLPIVSGTALEIKVGDWVVEQAVKQLDEWRLIELQPVISINISSNHLLSNSFFDMLEALFTKYPLINSSCIELEILENSALGDLNMIHDVLERCKSDLGVGVALDDFGTGYSSLTHLSVLPVSTIKIDRSFVRDLLDDPNDYSIIDGVIGLTNAFRRNVIAEGVETTAQGLMLLAMGCFQAQGYAIAKPMPADEFPLWLKNYLPNQDWLKCAQKQFSAKDKKLKLFQLATLQWQDKFVNYIQSSRDSALSPPIMDITECHCGRCINWLSNEQKLVTGSVKVLEQIHEKFHIIADSIFHHYQLNDHQKVMEGMNELQEAFFYMHSVLDEYKAVS